MSLGFQVSNVLGSAISPIVATILTRETGSVHSIAANLVAVLAVSALSIQSSSTDYHRRSLPQSTRRH